MSMESVMTVSLFGGALAGLAITLPILLIFFVLKAIPLARVAKELGSEKAFMAWLPFGQDYLTGWAGDRLNEQNGRKVWHMGRYALVSSFFYVPYFTGLFVLLGGVAAMMSGGAGAVVIVLLVTGSLLLGISWLAIMAGQIIQYVATYAIFKQYAPDSATLYLVISILLTGPGLMLMIATRQKPAAAQQ